MKMLVVNIVTVFCILLSSTLYGHQLQPLTSKGIKLPDSIKEVEDVSAIAKVGSFIVIGSDEAVDKKKNYIQLLKKGTGHSYEIHSNILLEDEEKVGKELDTEGIAAEGNTLYIIGSHSSKRKKVIKGKKDEEEDSYKKNQKKFHDTKIKDETNRDWLYRVTIDPATGKKVDMKRISLREIIQNDPVLRIFSNIPSKENGVDIEGISVKGDFLYIGFRGPVFRQNFVPVMKLQFNEPKGYKLLYVNLKGYGIRDMTSVSDGFLILSGPVGDALYPYQLYHWDGKDVVPGNDRNTEDVGKINCLGYIEPPDDGKAEGIVVLQEEKELYNLIIVYDGVKNKDNIMQLFNVKKP